MRCLTPILVSSIQKPQYNRPPQHICGAQEKLCGSLLGTMPAQQDCRALMQMSPEAIPADAPPLVRKTSPYFLRFNWGQAVPCGIHTSHPNALQTGPTQTRSAFVPDAYETLIMPAHLPSAPDAAPQELHVACNPETWRRCAWWTTPTKTPSSYYGQ